MDTIQFLRDKLTPRWEETWRAIAGTDDYEVSNLGRVRSLDRIVKGGRWSPEDVQHLRGRILKTQTHANYKTVALSHGGQYKNHYVHILVAEAFVSKPAGVPIDNLEVNHVEGFDNAALNLEWRTHRGNQQHGAKHELMCGDGVYFSKTRKKYIAQFSPIPNHQKNLGGYDTYAEAKSVRDEAVKSMTEVL